MDLIPSRLMNVTLESYLLRISTRSKIIYWIIIVLFAGSVALLPFIHVDVAVRAKGCFNAEINKPAGSEEELIATCYINPSDISLIAPDQKVRIQIDALNNKEWGLLEAKIIDISDEMIIENGSSFYFIVHCKPESRLIKHKNGMTANLKNGMNFSARIIITHRSLFNLLFDKADNWTDPSSAKSEKNI